ALMVCSAVLIASSIGIVQAQSHQEAVAKTGAPAMPFDLAQTTHVFQALEDGGVAESCRQKSVESKTDCVDSVSLERRIGKISKRRLFRPGENPWRQYAGIGSVKGRSERNQRSLRRLAGRRGDPLSSKRSETRDGNPPM